MIDKLSPYSEYRNVQSSWLARIPSHWEMRRLKNLFREVDRRTATGEEKLFSLRMRAGLVGHIDAGGKPFASADLVGFKKTSPGQLVMNRMRAASGLFGIAKDEGLVSPDYAVFEPIGPVHLEFALHLFKTPMLGAVFRAESKGLGTGDAGFLRLYTDRFGTVAVPIPRLEEQAAIVRFLVHADRRIGKYIAAKRKLIALLNEQKQAIVQRIVTRGVISGVRLKPSGLAWLGDVPAHWKVLRCKYLFREQDRRSKDGGETHLSMSQRLGLVPRSQLEQRTLVSESYAGGKLVEPGDLVLNRLKAHLGVFAVARQAGVISPDYTVFRPRIPMTMSYFSHVLRSPACRSELRMRAKGLVEGFWRLYSDDFYDIKVPVPPVPEQEAMVAAISDQARGLDSSIATIEREVALIQELRAAVVSDVVIGRYDVRSVALTEESPTEVAEHFAAVAHEQEDDGDEEVVVEDEEAVA